MENFLKEEVIKTRMTGYPIHPLMQSRCSPRAMTGEEMTDDELMGLFEAARWAPSSYNGQHWRFIYGKRHTPHWNKLYDVLIDFNKQWTKNASALVLIISRNTFEKNNKPARTHSFDTGAAWMALALEANHRGLVAHGMEGFDYDKIKASLKIPDDYTVEAMVALGKPAPINSLPEEIRNKETPSERRPLSEIVMEGSFNS